MSQRLQLYFPDDQYRELKTLARKRRQPMASIVREAVARYLPGADALGDLREDALFRIIASAGEDGETNWAEDHDTILYPQVR